jgi:hypothetical protein
MSGSSCRPSSVRSLTDQNRPAACRPAVVHPFQAPLSRRCRSRCRCVRSGCFASIDSQVVHQNINSVYRTPFAHASLPLAWDFLLLFVILFPSYSSFPSAMELVLLDDNSATASLPSFSDKLCFSPVSSGASCTSASRDSSPDFGASGSVHGSSPPVLPTNLTGDIIEAASQANIPLVVRDTELANMDRGSLFGSVSLRCMKIGAGGVGDAGQGQHRGQGQQSDRQQGFAPACQMRGGGLAQMATIPRGVLAANWRVPQNLTNIEQRQNPILDTPNALSAPLYFDMGPGFNNNPYMGYHNVEPSAGGGTYGYCFDRGNGMYTPLIPADMLPPLRDIPPLQHGSTGMIVLPTPQGAPPYGINCHSTPIILKVSFHFD